MLTLPVMIAVTMSFSARDAVSVGSADCDIAVSHVFYIADIVSYPNLIFVKFVQYL